MTCDVPHTGSCPNLDSRKNIARYYKHLCALPQFVAAARILPKSGNVGKGEAPAKIKVKIVCIAYRYVFCPLLVKLIISSLKDNDIMHYIITSVNSFV